MTETALLAVRNLTVRYPGAPWPALDRLDLDLPAGRCLAVVGPSGCGKSTLCRALLDLLPPGTERSGSIRWEGRELAADRAAWHALRGRGLALVLQDHRHALDPVRRVGDQVAEVLGLHHPEIGRDVRPAAVQALLSEVRLPAAAGLARRYPHELSGGQRQRVCLAAALAASPRILLADEPTTALDLAVQRDLMALLSDLVRRRRLGLLLVTHDHDLVPLVADAVLDLGETITAPTGAQAASGPVAHPPANPCLEVRDLSVEVPASPRPRRVVHHVDLSVAAGRTLGLVGESGCGKTSLVRAVAGWLEPATGTVRVHGTEGWPEPARRRAVQLVSQDASAALNPQQRIRDAVVEAARAAGLGAAAHRATEELLAEVDLAPKLAARKPRQLSGGQRQRAQLARALAARPRVLLADEPTSSLDGPARQRLLALLRTVQLRRGLALVLVSHDLSLLESYCDTVAVMFAGHIVELYRPAIVDGPRHPFARDLAAAAPANLIRLRAAGRPMAGEPEPDQQPLTDGCPYQQRCRLVESSCRTGLPALVDCGDGHLVRCPVTDRDVR